MTSRREEVGMLNAMIWALACFGVVAADIALSVVLFSALGVASVFMGFRSMTSTFNCFRPSRRQHRF